MTTSECRHCRLRSLTQQKVKASIPRARIMKLLAALQVVFCEIARCLEYQHQQTKMERRQEIRCKLSGTIKSNALWIIACKFLNEACAKGRDGSLGKVKRRPVSPVNSQWYKPLPWSARTRAPHATQTNAQNTLFFFDA